LDEHFIIILNKGYPRIDRRSLNFLWLKKKQQDTWKTKEFISLFYFLTYNLSLNFINLMKTPEKMGQKRFLINVNLHIINFTAVMYRKESHLKVYIFSWNNLSKMPACLR